MSGQTCGRAWEAEAVEDGRLASADRESFERHAAMCADCAREVDAHASLRRTMREVAPAQPTALASRRARVALFHEAHARGTRLGPRIGYRWVVAAAAALLVAWIGARHVAPTRLAPATAAISVAGPLFDVVSVSGAEVTSRTENGVTRAVLAVGMAAFHVEHVGAGRRFLLELPDGELEVRGTRFVVNVRGARTQSVDVTEGIVVLRLRGDGERQLRAGDRWTAPALASVEAVQVAPSVSDEPVHRALASPMANRARPLPVASVPSASETGRPLARLAANERFARAVAAFQVASYEQADALLASFAHDFPDDARTEDASFLRAVARSRAGDASGAASLARDYLQSFPRGLRRREADDIARKAASSPAAL